MHDWLYKAILITGFIFCLCCLCTFCYGIDYTGLPSRCKLYIPVLLEQNTKYWPSMNEPSLFCGQIETETCTSLKSKRCWNPTTELKTSREYGFGLGQITIGYNKRGEVTFNNFDMVRNLNDDLRHWQWKDRYNALFQLRALVLYDHALFQALPKTNDLSDSYAFMFAAYNGGLGGLKSDIALCKAKKGCDPTKWFGNVENTSLKSRKKYHGYGKSFFEINREYPRGILGSRRVKYVRAGLN